MQKTAFFIFSVLYAFNSFGIIKESLSHDTITSHITNEKTIVIFDLDNTLFAPSGTDAGSDQWFAAELQKRSLDEVLPEYFQLQKCISLELTESTLPEIICQLQKKGVIVIALTARSPELEQQTITELKRLGVHFTHIFEQNDITERPFHYHHGVIFAGNRNKGEVLKDILKEADLHPDHIIFTDDKLKNITPVEQTVEDLGIKFTGLRYSGCDERVAKFNAQQAELDKQALLSATHSRVAF